MHMPCVAQQVFSTDTSSSDGSRPGSTDSTAAVPTRPQRSPELLLDQLSYHSLEAHVNGSLGGVSKDTANVNAFDHSDPHDSTRLSPVPAATQLLALDHHYMHAQGPVLPLHSPQLGSSTSSPNYATVTAPALVINNGHFNGRSRRQPPRPTSAAAMEHANANAGSIHLHTQQLRSRPRRAAAERRLAAKGIASASHAHVSMEGRKIKRDHDAISDALTIVPIPYTNQYTAHAHATMRMPSSDSESRRLLPIPSDSILSPDHIIARGAC